MQRRTLLLFIALIMIPFLRIFGQQNDLFQSAQLVHKGDTLPYRILYPKNYDAEKKYPVVFFLHGAGERGIDNDKQLVHGSKVFLDSTVREDFPAIVIFPQCPADSYWSNVEFQYLDNGQRLFNFQMAGKPTKAMRLLQRLVKQQYKHPNVDPNQFYVAGLSMGGMGTLELLRRMPTIFAAAIAICGGDHSVNVKKYAHIPLWIIHGELDDVVPPDHSRILVDHLIQLGAKPRTTFYPKANHNSWDSAFAEPDFVSWLFKHQKK
jgi:predicted peptidase